MSCMSCGIDGLIAEHLMYSDRCVISILTHLFNSMLHFETAPNVFGESLSFQIPKTTKSAFLKNSSDYRGRSISPIVSKIYEYCLIEKFGDFL